MITKQGYEGFPVDYDVKADSGVYAGVSIKRIGLDRFVFDTVSGQVNGTAFTISIKAVDKSGKVYTVYNGSNTLSASTGSITPSSTGAFANGVWSGSVTLSKPGSGIRISTTGEDKSGVSNEFEVKSSSPTTTTGSGIPFYSLEAVVMGIIIALLVIRSRMQYN